MFLDLDELEDLVCWNMSFGISVLETLTELKALEYIHLF